MKSITEESNLNKENQLRLRCLLKVTYFVLLFIFISGTFLVLILYGNEVS